MPLTLSCFHKYPDKENANKNLKTLAVVFTCYTEHTVVQYRPVTSLGYHVERSVFWEGPNFLSYAQSFQLYPTNFFRGAKRPHGYGPGTVLALRSCVKITTLCLWCSWDSLSSTCFEFCWRVFHHGLLLPLLDILFTAPPSLGQIDYSRNNPPKSLLQ